MPTSDRFVAAGPPMFDSSFIGRRREVGALRLLVDGSARLVTLTGVGGSGKTRLAAELFSALAEERARASSVAGVVWVDLSAVREPDDVALSVAGAFGLRDAADSHTPVALAHAVADDPALLFLDNCEEVSAACRGLVDELVAECRGLVVVATSRVPLGARTEQLVQVPPMDVRAGVGEPSEAAELFYDRAARVLPGYTDAADDVAVVNALCQRVDGIPLAIELAAPWIRTLSARDLLAEIDRGADVLASRDPLTTEQHRSMRAVLDSTWRRMGDSSRAALRRLSVFVGGFTSAAAERVADTSATMLVALADLSLVHELHGAVGGARYGLHELVRTYALEMLHREGPDEVDQVRTRHLEYCLDLFERAYANLNTADELRWIQQTRPELPNAGAALRWAYDHGRAEQALRLTAALAPAWTATSASGRFRGEFDEALALPWDPSSDAQSRARAGVLSAAGWAAMTQRDWEPAQHHFTESSDLYRELGDQVLYALGLCDVGWAVSRRPDPTLALGYLRQALAICERLGDPPGIAWATYNLGEVLFVLGRDAQAEALVLDGQRQLTRLGIGYGVYVSQVTLGHAYRRQARWAAAIEAYLGAVRAQQLFLQRTHGADVLAGLGVAALALDRPDCAARMFGACRAWADAHSDMSLLNPSRDLLSPRADAESRLADPGWARQYTYARRQTTEQALTMAAADAEELLLRSRAPFSLGLSERELEVLRLVALGLANSAIAEKLVLSPRTVQGHLRSVFAKLGVKNRSAAVHRATQAGLLHPV